MATLVSSTRNFSYDRKENVLENPKTNYKSILRFEEQTAKLVNNQLIRRENFIKNFNEALDNVLINTSFLKSKGFIATAASKLVDGIPFKIEATTKNSKLVTNKSVALNFAKQKGINNPIIKQFQNKMCAIAY